MAHQPAVFRVPCWRWVILALFCIFVVLLLPARPSATTGRVLAQSPSQSIYLPLITQGSGSSPLPPGNYVLLGWNDLGMHCINWEFSSLAVLPPYNTLWAQVVRKGDPPQIVTQGIRVDYSFAADPSHGYGGNTYSVGKTNFWTYAQQLFSLAQPLAANIGLTGKGLVGRMDATSDHFISQGIPITEYDDGALATRDPFQLATLVARDAATGAPLASLQVVAPVSSEMSCGNCHSDTGQATISITPTGKVETNILTLHDTLSAAKYPVDHTALLMTRQPVLCAECHSSNALNAAGVKGVSSLSNAVHAKHIGIVPDTKDGCYNCHPGPTTQCLRDVMSTQEGMDCISCHGGMLRVSQNLNPWLNEPRCDNLQCHGSSATQNNALYRFSTAHYGIYCEACHDSTHAIAPSSQPRDAIKFIQLQGHAGTLDTCTTCHQTQPVGNNHH